MVQSGGGEIVPGVGEVVVSLLVHRVHMLCEEVGHPLPVLLGGLAGIGTLQTEGAQLFPLRFIKWQSHLIS